ncbi:MAG: hypothetical protein KA712_14790 [Myxococcales bacterium]|nr:hypothetical protein [Myxococcales bacterium]
MLPPLVAVAAAIAYLRDDGPLATQGSDFLERRLLAEHGRPGPPLPAARLPPFPPRLHACTERARGPLAAGVEAFTRNPANATEAFERALVLDPDCVPAMRLGVLLAAHAGRLSAWQPRLVGRAERMPLSASAQLGAALFSDFAGRSGDMLAFLERAQQLRPDLPGLAAAKADYLRFHAGKHDLADLLDAWQTELSRGDDPRTLANLILFFASVPDRDATKTLCTRFFSAAPLYRGQEPALACLKGAIERGDQDEADVYATRVRPGEPPDCQARTKLYFRFLAGDPRAQAEAAAPQTPCAHVYPWLRGAALLGAGQYAVGLAALEGAPETPAWIRASALALNGRRAEAIDTLTASQPPENSPQRLLLQLLRHDLVDAPGLQASFRPLRAQGPGALAAEAACGYLDLGLRAQAQSTLGRAVSAAPGDPSVAACQIRVFLATGDFASANAVAARSATLGLDDPRYLAALGHLRRRENRCGEALAALAPARRAAPLTASLYPDLVYCLRREGKTEEAEPLARVQQDERDPWTLVGALSAAVALLGVGALFLRRRRRRQPP